MNERAQDMATALADAWAVSDGIHEEHAGCCTRECEGLVEWDELVAERDEAWAEVDRLCEAVYERADNCLRAEWERDDARSEVARLRRLVDENSDRLQEPHPEVERLRAERDEARHEQVADWADINAALDELERLRATVARVEALADKWEAIPYGKRTPYDVGWHDALDICETELRDALDGDPC